MTYHNTQLTSFEIEKKNHIIADARLGSTLNQMFVHVDLMMCLNHELPNHDDDNSPLNEWGDVRLSNQRCPLSVSNLNLRSRILCAFQP